MVTVEVWKDVVGYEGSYEVSSLGNIKSLSRILYMRGKHPYISNEKILKPKKEAGGYVNVRLYLNSKYKIRKIHQLVAEAFLGHVVSKHKLVVNHKNHIRSDNRVENLEIITQRDNCNKKHLKTSSIYVGVSWNNINKNWVSRIRINSKVKHLGCYLSEFEAHIAYQKELNKHLQSIIVV